MTLRHKLPSTIAYHPAKRFEFSYEETNKTLLGKADLTLVEAAEQVAETAYAPYSKFRVGAAVLLDDGRIITGSNHENASFPAGICAERAALSTLDMRDGAPRVTAIAVTYLSARKAGTAMEPLSPCGLCRQSILEVQQWQNAPIRLLLCAPDGQVISVPDAAFLLPFSFGSKVLAEAGSAG